MDDAVELGLEAFQGPVLDHHHKVTKPVKRAARRVTGREKPEQDDSDGRQDHDDRNGRRDQDKRQRQDGRQDQNNERNQYEQGDRYNQQGRRDQQSRNDQAMPLGGYARRPGMNRRTSSLDRGAFAGGAAGGYSYGQNGARQKDPYYDSESASSTSSRDRRLRRRRTDGGANGRQTKSQGRGRRDSYSSSSTSVDEISSEEDQKKRRKLKGKELLTAGLAAVATLHAGQKVYQASTATHARHKAVREGKMTQEEADKKRNRYRFQEVASLGIAALGIKGVFEEWKGVQDKHKEAERQKEIRDRHREKKEQHHRQRSRRRSSPGDYRRSELDMRRG